MAQFMSAKPQEGVRYSEREQFLAGEATAAALHTPRKRYYTPAELRTPILLAFCILTLIVFALLQIAGAAFYGAPGLHALIARSPQSDCPPGATCAPAPGSWTNPTPSSPTSTPTPGAPAPGSWTDSTTSTGNWTQGDYFVGAYLPTLAAILFSIGWKCIFARLKEMEPFYQLTKPRGAKVRDSLLLSYTGANLSRVLYSSLSAGHWLVFLGSVNSILITICTAFASETLYISTTGSACRVIVDPSGSTNNDCRMQLTMRPILSWILGAVLLFIFAFTAVLTVRLRDRVSGIFAEATSMTGIATLYNGSLSQGFLPSLQNSSSRYALTVTEEGRGMNYIVDLTPVPFQPLPQNQLATLASKKKESHASVHPVALSAFVVYLAAVLFLILYYRFVSKPGTGNGLETFMDSQTFGLRLLMACIGLAIKFYWSSVERYMRRMAPYIALTSSNGATADQSVLVRSPSHPITALFHGHSWRNLLFGLVTLMTVLSEVLVITLTTVPFSVATAYLAFEISVYISVGILGLMVLVIPAVIVWRLTKTSESPAPPESIADVFALLGDAVACRFGALGTLDRKERDRIVRSWNLRYSVRRTQAWEQQNGFQSDWRVVVIDPRGGMP